MFSGCHKFFRWKIWGAEILFIYLFFTYYKGLKYNNKITKEVTKSTGYYTNSNNEVLIFIKNVYC